MLIDGAPGSMLPATDRGLQYGDGLFETIAVLEGRALLWDRHVDRLRSGCARLGIPCPEAALLAEDAARLVRGRSQAVLKIIVTRGTGDRGYTPPDVPAPKRIVSVHDWPPHPPAASSGVDAPLCRIRLARQPALAGLKHLNRLEQVLARQELLRLGAAEGVMLDSEGLVIEGTMSNVFAVCGDELWTPDLSACGVEGVVRAEILDRAADWNLRAVTRPCTPEDLISADECFLTNSTIGIWPLNSLGGRPLRRGGCAMEIASALAAGGCIVPP